MDLIARVAVTKYYKPIGLNNRNCLTAVEARSL